MKRLLLFAALLVFMSTGYAQNPKFTAVSPSGHTLSYEIDPINNGIPGGGAWVTCEVAHYSVHFNNAVAYPNISGDIIVPDSVSYNGTTYPVTAIGNRAFYRCENINSITLPSTIIWISEYSFYNCSGIDTTIAYSEIAPAVESNTAFIGMATNVKVLVPCASVQSYVNTWGNTFDFQCLFSFSFNVIINTNDSTWGTGSYTALGDSIAKVTATANYGYHFDHWSYGSTANPDTLLLSSDVTITAFFAKNQYSVTGTSNDNTKGIVTGGTTVDYLDSVTLTATPNYGYHFLRWSDYHTENPRTVTATSNINLTAVFDFNQYTITLSVDSSIHGTVSGAGEYNYLSERTISANANYGYHFTMWSDGITDNPRTITLTQDTTFIAMFDNNQYTLTVLSSNSTFGLVMGGGVYDYLDVATLETFSEEHYHFVRWSDGNTDTPRHYIVTGNDTLIALFVIDTHIVNVHSNDIARGMVEASGTEFEYGKPCTLTATAYTGYTFAGWSNGVTANPYTFAVLSDVELTALFVAEGDEVYMVNVETSDPTMGSVSGGGQRIEGDTMTIRAIANNGYRFVRWNDNDTNDIRTIIVTSDITYIAYFESTTQRIGDVELLNSHVYSCQGQIIVEGADGIIVTLYDINGRMLATKQDYGTALRFHAPASGIYMIKIGNHSARKVVVIK